MPRVIGVDVGATLCKVVPLDAPADAVLCASADWEAVQACVRSFDAARIGVTGGGAGRLVATLAPRPVTTVDEFAAWAAGARVLATGGPALPDRHLLASVGTGTSILLVESGTGARVGGTAIGGGTFMGLGRLLAGECAFGALTQLAAAGDRRPVDLLVAEVYREAAGPLLGDLTAANFGKATSHRREDLMAALATLVGETVALMATALARGAGVDTVVYCGSTLAENPAVTAVVDDITRRFGAVPRFLPGGAYCGALGAAVLAAP